MHVPPDDPMEARRRLGAERPVRSLFLRADVPEGRLEPTLLGLLPALFRAIEGRPELESLLFARYRWQILLRVVGTREWIDDSVGPDIERRIEASTERGEVLGHAFEEYRSEHWRYGGPEGVRLAEEFFTHDSLACLDLIEADAGGNLAVSRREFSLLLTERLCDLLGFDRGRRVELYRIGHAWALEDGTWEPSDLKLLEHRFQGLRAGLAELCRAGQARDGEGSWGGTEPARIAGRFLDQCRPLAGRLIAAHAAGRIAQDPVHFAWSLGHMHCVRLGIGSSAEAILRFFMYRLHQEEEVVAG